MSGVSRKSVDKFKKDLRSKSREKSRVSRVNDVLHKIAVMVMNKAKMKYLSGIALKQDTGELVRNLRVVKEQAPEGIYATYHLETLWYGWYWENESNFPKTIYPKNARALRWEAFGRGTGPPYIYRSKVVHRAAKPWAEPSYKEIVHKAEQMLLEVGI